MNDTPAEHEANDGLAVRLAEPIAPHTAWRTGGTCDAYVVAFHEEAAAEAILQCRQAGWAWQIVGATTRTVFRDGPVPGMVLRLGGELAHFRIDGTTLIAGAAAPVPALVAAAEARGLAGLEQFATTAGSIGGAVLLDDAWEDLVTSVRTLRRDKPVEDSLHAVRKRKTRVVLGVRILLTADSPGAVQHRTESIWRAQSPTPACSWFAVPRRGNVRDILHSASLPLVRLRLAAIPDAAPECMVNLGGGTASDLNLLFKSAQDRVKKVRGIDLARAVQWTGNKAST